MSLTIRLSAAILLAALLCGCGGIFAPAPEPPAAARKTISLISFPDHPKKSFLSVFQQAGLDFDMNVVEVPQNQYEDKVRMMLFAREATDLVLIDAPNVASYATCDVLEPLGGFWPQEDLEDIVDSCRQALQWDGKTWCAPLNEAGCVLYYNKKIFKQEGIEPARSLADAWSLEKLLEVAIALTKTDSLGNVTRYGLMPSMFSPNNRNEGMTYTQLLFTWWFGAEVLSPDATTASGYFDSEENRAALGYYADLFNKYKVSPLAEIPNGFQRGEIVMWINGPWLLGVWRENDPDFYENSWGAMPLPHGVSAASASGSWNVAITKQSENKSEAWQAVQALTGKEGMKQWCGETGNIPARKSLLKQSPGYESQPFYGLIYDQMLATGRARPLSPHYPEISEALNTCYNSVAFGEDPDIAMKLATEKINKALGQTDEE